MQSVKHGVANSRGHENKYSGEGKGWASAFAKAGLQIVSDIAMGLRFRTKLQIDSHAGTTHATILLNYSGVFCASCGEAFSTR